jgi:hypothetical protein
MISKMTEEILDDVPILDAPILDFISWSANYYHHPIGEVLSNSKAMAVFYKIVKLVKNGVLMIIHIYAKVSLTSSSGGYINGRNSANLELLIDK